MIDARRPRRRPLWAALLMAGALALAGCSERDGVATRMAEDSEVPETRSSTLAVEHSVSIDVPEPDVRKVHDQALAACNAKPKGMCTVLSSRLGTGDEVWARLGMRATPEVVRSIIASLDQKGDVTSMETEATDLAKPIADADRSAAMLASYRDKLEQLAGRVGNDADALIKVHRELAEVQSKIEATAGEREQLRKQVELEILNVTIGAERHTPFSKPIAVALRDFGANLSQGIAGAITGLAVLLPGALVLAFVVACFRRWRRWRLSRAG